MKKKEEENEDALCIIKDAMKEVKEMNHFNRNLHLRILCDASKKKGQSYNIKTKDDGKNAKVAGASKKIKANKRRTNT